MNDLFKKITNKARKFSLTRKEREDIISRISTHVKENPLNTKTYSTASPYFFRFTYFAFSWVIKKRNKLLPIFAVLVILLLGGGVALAAHFSLPGDVLYPVKININEKLQSFFAVSPNAKIRVQTELANKRLKEAEKLVSNGKINTEAQEKIKKNFDEHARAADKLLREYKDKGNSQEAAKARSQFENDLKNHNENLNILFNNNEKNKEDIDEIKKSVGTHIDELIERNENQGVNGSEKRNENQNKKYNTED